MFLGSLFLAMVLATPIEDSIKASSVQIEYIEVFDVDKVKTTRTKYGSGTVVKSDEKATYVLSCLHVLSSIDPTTNKRVVNHGRVYVYTSDKKTVFQAMLVDVDPDHDLCLLKIGVSKLPFSVLAKQESYTPNIQMYLSGYANGGPLQLKTMLPEPTPAWIKHHDLSDWTGSVQFKPASTPGESGCGLFRASDGHLIGVVFARNLECSCGYAVYLRDVRAFLKKSNIGD